MQEQSKARKSSPPKETSDKKLLDPELQVAKSASEQATTVSVGPTSVTNSGSATAAVSTGDQSNVTAADTTAPPNDDGKKSPEPGSPDWVYADLPVSEVSFVLWVTCSCFTTILIPTETPQV